MSRYLQIAIAAVALIVVAGVGGGWWYWSSSQPEDPAAVEQAIIQAQTDQRDYQYLQLANGLKALLVSDPSTDKSAAALAVNIGAYADPKERQGMAHFLEHMLFLGTEKYPDAGDYATFIQQHGGSDNAYTSGEETVYYFDIDRDHLEPALDRFAQFFVAPLFTADLLDRERNAVDSEFKGGLKDDSRRFYDAYRNALNPDHPATKFTVGNLDTLHTENLRADVLRFYQAQYSAERMTLAVYGKDSIDQLRAWVEAKFSPVLKRGLGQPKSLPSLFKPGQLPLHMQVKPHKNLRELLLSFPVPGSLAQLDTRPYGYISWILNSEAKGSLADRLKQKGWIEGLSAGMSERSLNESTFDIDLSLTEEGLKNTDAVIALVFDQIDLIKQSGVNQWQHEEMVQLQRLRFNFQEAYDPISYVIRLTSNLRNYPEKRLLEGPYFSPTYDQAAIKSWLDKLNPNNLFIGLTSPNAKTNQKSKYYQTPYRVSRLDNQLISLWQDPAIDSSLKLPEENPFVPKDLALTPLEKEQSTLFEYLPDKYLKENGITLWFKQDDQFATPKADIYVALESQWFNQSLGHQSATELYLELVKDALNEISFDARLAGLGYNLWLNDYGISLRLYGYHDKLPLYLDAITNELVSLEVNEERFAALKAELVRNYQNMKRDRVISQLNWSLYRLVLPSVFSGDQMARATKKVSLEDLQAVQAQLRGQVHITNLIHGNLSSEQAVQMGQRLAGNFAAKAVDAPISRVMKLDKATAIYQTKINHNDSAIVMYYQGEASDFRQKALYSLLNHTMEQPFFNILRTEKQLGYSVYTRNLSLSRLPGISMTIQSPNVDPALLQRHIEKFMAEDFHKLLRNMTDEEFEGYKTSLIGQYLEKDKNLLESGRRYWTNIREQNSNFNRAKRVALEIEKITHTGLIKFYENQLLNEDARRLVVVQVGEGQEENYETNRRFKPGYKIVNSVAQYQDKRPYYEFQ